MAVRLPGTSSWGLSHADRVSMFPLRVGEAMRALILGSLALACGVSCGSSTPDGGSARTSPTQVNLTITTAGNGLGRGAGAGLPWERHPPIPLRDRGHQVGGPR